MISLKGLLLGLGLSVVGTLAFWVYTLHVLAPKPFFGQGPRTGFDVRIIQTAMLRNPAYWLAMLLLMVVGCAVIYFSHRATA